MKILLINKYHHVVGGAERYYFDLYTLLTRKGHDVAFFSMNHPDNLPTPWSKYFVSNINFTDIDIRTGMKIFFRMMYSREARQKISELLDIFTPDVAHIHNIYYHLSPSILMELKKRNIPVVYTIHDYHLLTPNVTFFHDGALCDISLKNNLYRAPFHACVQRSRAVSLATSLCLFVHDRLNVYKTSVDYFISPSLFLKRLLSDHGYNKKNIIHLPNFIDMSADSMGTSQPDGKYVLFVGDGSVKKGLPIVINVAKLLPWVTFNIAGRGTDTPRYRNVDGPHGLKNVVFLGFLSKKDLQKTTSRSAFVVVPSIWYENQPYSILESFALAKPVVASNIGGIPELVKNGKNGILFEPGNAAACAAAINSLWKNPGRIKKMGHYAQWYAQQKFNPDRHYKNLIEIYKKAQHMHLSKPH